MIAPDTKDWTWVLDETCPECGFDSTAVAFGDVAPAVRANAALWPVVLAGPGATSRPDDGTWSPTEYAAHVRDVHRIFEHRVRLMLAEDGPSFANWDQDVTAVEERYDLADPAEVAPALVAAAESVAAVYDGVPTDALDRTGFRSNGSAFTTSSTTPGTYADSSPSRPTTAMRPPTGRRRRR